MTGTKTPLAGLSEKQLLMVETLLANPDVLVKMTETKSYYATRPHAEARLKLPVPGDHSLKMESLARAITGPINAYGRTSKWADYKHVLGRTAKALVTKNVLVKLDEEGHYTLSNWVREAKGAVTVKMDELRAQRQEEIDREKAWKDAYAPLEKRHQTIKRAMYQLRQDAKRALSEPTADTLYKLHLEYVQKAVQLDELNADLLKISAEHGRESTPFTEGYY